MVFHLVDHPVIYQSDSVNNHGETHLVLLDISEDFERVWHEVLLIKLNVWILHRSHIVGIEILAVSEPSPSELMRSCPTHLGQMLAFSLSLLWTGVLSTLQTQSILTPFTLFYIVLLFTTHFVMKLPTQITNVVEHGSSWVLNSRISFF